MKAEILAIGDEMCSGERLDTNTQWIAQRLVELGIPVAFHTTVGDCLEDHVGVVSEALRRADVVISTGGLGPTADDLTREAIAAATHRELVLDQESLEHIQALFSRRRRREMPERNIVQAMFPAGSRVIRNPHGTAPGIDLDVERDGRPPARLIALPGVPAELHEMWDESVHPALTSQLGDDRRMIRHHVLKCFGVGESDLEQMLPDLIRRGRTPTVGITVSQATITLRVTGQGLSPDDCLQNMAPTIATIRDCLGDLIFGEEHEELEHAVLRKLAERKATLATIEWGSAGLVTRWLSEAAPSTHPQGFRGGLVVADRESAQTALGLSGDPDLSQSELTQQMARRGQEVLGADYVLAIGAFGDWKGASPPRYDYALAQPDRVRRGRGVLAGHPDIVVARAAKQALNFVRLALE